MKNRFKKLRISFLCSSLEPGRDGVGDYTTLLAQECVRQGHQTALVALNDRHIEQAIEGRLGDSTTTGLTEIPYLRLPSVIGWKERTAHAAAFLQAFVPDCVSLQFVCYGFQDKGIVLGLERFFSQMISSIRPRPVVNIMFHELWIGVFPSESIINRAVGIAQRHGIQQFIKILKPEVVHTTNYASYTGIRQLNVSAKMLPLFGNIPVVGMTADRWLFPLLQNAGVPITNDNRDEFWICGIFGTIFPVWPPEPLLSTLCEAADVSKKSHIVFLTLGRMGAGKSVWNKMVTTHRDKIYFLSLGEMSEKKISECIATLDFGIATTPLSLLGKSSTVAALLDHGVPVVVNRFEEPSWMKLASPQHKLSDYLHGTYDTERISCLIYAYEEFDLLKQKMQQGLIKQPPSAQLPRIAERFIKDMSFRNFSS